MGRIAQEMSPSVERMQLGHIMPYHREIARRLVLGQRQCDIAEMLGMTQGRISIICNSPLFKIELQKLSEMRDNGVGDVTKTLQDISPIALEVLERTMLTTRSDGIRLKAAESILDRAGYGAINKSLVNVRKTVTYDNMTPNELKELVKQRLERVNQESQVNEQLEQSASTIEIKFDEETENIKDVKGIKEFHLPPDFNNNECSKPEQALDIYDRFI